MTKGRESNTLGKLTKNLF